MKPRSGNSQFAAGVPLEHGKRMLDFKEALLSLELKGFDDSDVEMDDEAESDS